MKDEDRDKQTHDKSPGGGKQNFSPCETAIDGILEMKANDEHFV